MYIIDRIENGVIVIETPDGFINVDKENVEGNIQEGSVLTKTDGKFTVDNDATINRRKIIIDKQNSLFDD